MSMFCAVLLYACMSVTSANESVLRNGVDGKEYCEVFFFVLAFTGTDFYIYGTLWNIRASNMVNLSSVSRLECICKHPPIPPPGKGLYLLSDLHAYSSSE